MVLHIFTDGSCINNGKADARGGIGIYMVELDYRYWQSYVVEEPTNQRCELYAILKALETYINYYMENGGYKDVVVYSDSMYSINAATKWIKDWRKRGWKTAGKGDVKNLWLIQQIDYLQGLYDKLGIKLEYRFVKAHRKEMDKGEDGYFEWEGNNIVDKLAKKGAENGKKLFYKK